ncbi:MAG: hypothetical protein ACLPTZ_13750 [Beijerinckiaceae bacterium]|jgi:hypothetical protein
MKIETFEDAIRWRKVHRKALKTATRRQRRAARPVIKCRRGHRCGTEACRVCMREFRLSWLGEAVKIMVQRADWTRCSVITGSLLAPCGQLQKFDLAAAVKRIRKRLQRSTIRDRIVLGGLDVSLNVENNVVSGWQFHLYLLIEGKYDDHLQTAVKEAFPAEPKALAPYDFVEVTNPLEAVTYAYKALIGRRSGYVGSNGNHRTADQPLKGADLRELLPFLASYKVGARLILSGVRRNGRRLVFTPRKRSSAPQS